MAGTVIPAEVRRDALASALRGEPPARAERGIRGVDRRVDDRRGRQTRARGERERAGDDESAGVAQGYRDRRLTVSSSTGWSGEARSCAAQTSFARSRSPLFHSTSPKWAAISASGRFANARRRYASASS